MTLFQSPTFKFYFLKLGFVLLLPTLIWCLIWIWNFEGPEVISDKALTLCLAAFLGLGFWNLDKLPSVQGQPIRYRLAVGSFQGFFMGAFVVLTNQPSDGPRMAIQFAIMLVIYGGSQALWYRGKPKDVPPGYKVPTSFLFLLVMAHLLAYLVFFTYDDPARGLMVPIILFGALGFPTGPAKWVTTEGKVFTITSWALTCATLYFFLS